MYETFRTERKIK